MKTFVRDNGLTIALVALFLFSGLGMIWSGHSAYNEELQHHGSPANGLLADLMSGQFLSALFENWESEFLQMSAYVMLTAMLFQRGSAESRDPDDPDRPDDELPATTLKPGPVLVLLLLAGDSVGRVVRHLLFPALVGELGSRQRGGASARRSGTIACELSFGCQPLVRILPELAVGVHVD